MANDNDLKLLVMEIIEFQKLIESRHITHTGPTKNDQLTEEAFQTLKSIETSALLSNLRVRLHGYYIKNSHVKNDNERKEIVSFFSKNLPSVRQEDLRHTDRIYLYQSYVWYYYILLDFENCLNYAERWVEIFEELPELKMLDPDLYMRGYHYLLTAAYNLREVKKLSFYLNKLEEFRKSNYARFNENSKIFSFLYVHWSRYNRHFLDGDFERGLELIPRTMRRIKRYKNQIAPHRILVFYYKIAWTYLGNDMPGKALNFVTMIINQDDTNFREDIQIYSQLLFLMIHYDLDNVDLLPYLVRRVEGFYRKLRIKNKLQARTLEFFKKVPARPLGERPALLNEFYNDLLEIREDPYEKRAFLYLDILSWILAKIQKKRISLVVRDGIQILEV
jgi:hypothetical protein